MPRTAGPDRAALSRFKEKFDKSFGTEALTAPPRKVISTGSLELDYALGIGGLLQGRIYQTWGAESTSKSTVNMLMLAQQQKAEPNRMCAWLDMEQTFEPDWAKAHGVDLNQLWVVYPSTAEDVADQVKTVMESDIFSFIVLDSIGGMIGDKEFEKDAGEATVGLVAKVVTRMVKMGAVRARQKSCTLSIVNQVRAAIGSYGADTTTGGGWALKHVTSAQIKTRKTATPAMTAGSGDNKRVVGQEFAFLIEKNKIAPPKAVANITLFNQETDEYGPIGIDRASEAFNLGKRLGLFTQSGGHYTVADGTKLHGEGAVKAHFRKHPEQIETVRTAALESIAHKVVTEENTA